MHFIPPLSSEGEREPTCQWHVAVARTTGHGWPYLTILSSEVSWYSLLEWHLPEVMMNYLESDGRVASSEVRRACSQNVVMPRLDRGIQKNLY